MPRRLDELVLSGRTVILAVVTILTALAAVSYWRLEVENSVDAWFAESDPDYQRYNEFRELFEADETLFVVLRAPDPSHTHSSTKSPKTHEANLPTRADAPWSTCTNWSDTTTTTDG